MKNSNIACLVLLLTAIGVTQGQTSSPSNALGAFVDLDGGRLYYEECGNGGDTVVLLHDGAANSAVWDDVWPAFCKQFHTIRYDRRGYGRSPATTKPYYEADDLAALLYTRKVTMPLLWLVPMVVKLRSTSRCATRQTSAIWCSSVRRRPGFLTPSGF